MSIRLTAVGLPDFLTAIKSGQLATTTMPGDANLDMVHIIAVAPGQCNSSLRYIARAHSIVSHYEVLES